MKIYNKTIHLIACIVVALALSACSLTKKEEADLILFNGTVITMNDSQSLATVVVVKDGVVIAVGDSLLLNRYSCPENNRINLKGKYLYPGLIDAHCHFMGYARNLLNCDLQGTASWNEVLEKVSAFAAGSSSKWIQGRGWDQNDWAEKAFPDNSALNTKFPDRPVVLKRIDGHAVICNNKALEMAGISMNTRIPGGELIQKDGKLSGVLVDNAVDLLTPFIESPSPQVLLKALKQAEQECFAFGLTTLADAGLPLNECLYLDSLCNSGQLSIFLYMMLNPDKAGLEYAVNNGIRETPGSRIGSFKLYADGALGSRGAKLKQDYCDRRGHNGLLIQSPSFYDSFCRVVYNQTQYQVNTHCIGDSANKLLLETYGRNLKPGDGRLWRIEHAQVLDPSDMTLFKQYSVVPSVQPTHAGSDGPWVEDRLCSNRMDGAYAYKTLLNQNGWLALGTDFPVEYINPFYTFYSAVFRLNATKPDQKPFMEKESLTPEQALKGMTIWAARACMLDHRKGSIAIGKDADMVIMDTDLRTASSADVLKTKVIQTYSKGKLVYRH